MPNRAFLRFPMRVRSHPARSSLPCMLDGTTPVLFARSRHGWLLHPLVCAREKIFSSLFFQLVRKTLRVRRRLRVRSRKTLRHQCAARGSDKGGRGSLRAQVSGVPFFVVV